MNAEINTEYTIYFAGALFDHKELIGNAILASYINTLSKEKYRCILPQDLEQSTGRSVDIRNQDLSCLLACDLAIFNFDGTELDSGTVVEFLYAKTLDIPAVIIRSDFRGSGDQNREGDQWNLMASFYPRTRKLEFNAMEWYQREINSLSNDQGILDTVDRLYRKISNSVITELDIVMQTPPLLSTDQGQAFSLYQWASVFPGSGLKEIIPNIDDIIISKKNKGLID
ncbi:MAG: Nucleoside 2-deoxyribosyltransferase [Chloroflexi bacterium]|jgi:nucleoside 2-deoxyribosyltransferase|nr:MAG: Nucleoside 2-deoxyribosyltransferase [Chloroflexota bacterium]